MYPPSSNIPLWLCVISATRPDNPGALCFSIFFSIAVTSEILMQAAGSVLL